MAEETFYSIGDRFIKEYSWRTFEYILAQVDYHMVALIDLKDGNRWHHPQKVVSPYKITWAELYEITAREAFKQTLSTYNFIDNLDETKH